MQSKAKTVSEYLASLPEDRRAAVGAVRKTILKNLDKDYEEGMQYGMIGYYVPHSVFPPGYHCSPEQPLPFAGLASQKQHLSVYIMSMYEDEARWLAGEFVKAGKRLDMGRCCIRFKKLEDLPLDVIGEAIRRMPAKKYVAWYQSALDTRAKDKAAGKAAGPAKKKAKKAGAPKKAAGKKTTRRT